MLERVLYIFLSLLFAFATQAYADAVHLREFGPTDFNNSIEVFEDISATMSLDDVLVMDKAGLFIPRQRLQSNGFGFTRSTIWVKSRISNDSSSSEWIVGSTRPDFVVLDVYLLDPNGKLQVAKQFGTSVDHKEFNTRIPAGRLSLIPGDEYTLFMKVRSPLQLSLTFFLLDENGFLNYALSESLFYFAYFGTVIALILYNLFLFLFLRYRDYLFYVIFGLAMLINAYVQAGFAEFFGLHIPFLGSTSDACRILLFPAIASVLYTRSFLRLRIVAPRLNRVMGYIIWLEGAFALFLWTDISFEYLRFVSYFDVTAVVLVFVAAVIAIRKGDKSAKVFLFAWGILAATVVIWVLGNNGILAKNMFVADVPLFGNMCEMVLMSIALALRIKEIDQQKLAAEMRAREKDNLQHLLRMVCHDISNPLSIIKTVFYLGERRDQASPEEIRNWQRVRRASDSIEAIINQVRKYEEFRSGKIAFELKACSLKKVFEELEFFFAGRAQDKGISLTCRFQPGIDDIFIMADGVSLTHEVMNNLVSNAIKFSMRGGSVLVEAIAKAGFASITVKDNGIGMSEDVLARIFDNHGHTTRFGTAREVGSGFGMPLVKTFLEMFGGEISISSVPMDAPLHDLFGSKPPTQHGTTICIRLKIAEPEP